MKIIDYYFYLWSVYMRIGVDEGKPSLLTGSFGVGAWFSALSIMTINELSNHKIQAIINANKIIIIVALFINILLFYLYYRRNNKYNIIYEYYHRKKSKYEILFFILFSFFMYYVAFIGIPFILKQIIKLFS